MFALRSQVAFRNERPSTHRAAWWADDQPGRRNIPYRVRSLAPSIVVRSRALPAQVTSIVGAPHIWRLLASPGDRRYIEVLSPKRTRLVDDRWVRQSCWSYADSVFADIGSEDHAM